MRISPTHFRALAQHIKSAAASTDLHAAVDKYRSLLLTPQRFRWDLFWKANKVHRDGMSKLISEIYKYCNDSHIDTALKAIMQECGLPWAAETKEKTK